MVCHSKLFITFQSYGIVGELLTWIKAFISNGMQHLSLNNVSYIPCMVYY